MGTRLFLQTEKLLKFTMLQSPESSKESTCTPKMQKTNSENIFPKKDESGDLNGYNEMYSENEIMEDGIEQLIKELEENEAALIFEN